MRTRPVPPVRVIESLFVMFCLLISGWFIFHSPERALHLKYLVFPFLVWSGLRLQQRTTAAMVVMLTALGVAGTTRAEQWLDPAVLDHHLLVLQTFMGVLSATALSLGAASAERRRMDAERTALLARQQAAGDETRRLLDEVSAYRDRLEQLVNERTQALAGSMEQLRRSERLASLGTLAAGIAHEINNPQNTILLSAQEALASGAGAEKDAALQIISAEAMRGGRIVKNVLAFSREERTERTRGDLNEIVRRTSELARTFLTRPGVSLQVELAPVLPAVEVNATEIEQVITNLVKNAAEAGKGSPVRIVLRTRAETAAAVLTIQDDGAGIPAEHLPRIFDPFFSTRIASGGTGLGLSICHSIIAAHGGSIAVASKPGEGTLFTIRLPAHRDAAAGSPAMDPAVHT
jgi:signal transduction histidine kinase